MSVGSVTHVRRSEFNVNAVNVDSPQFRTLVRPVSLVFCLFLKKKKKNNTLCYFYFLMSLSVVDWDIDNHIQVVQLE